MIVPQVVDLDWLHYSIDLIQSGRYRYRAEGKTVAYLHLMLGEYEVGDPNNTYLYVGQTTRHTEDVKQDFVNLIHRTYGERAVSSKTNNVVVTSSGQRFFFMSLASMTPQSIRGLYIDRIFFDVDDATQREYDRQGKLQELFNSFMPALTYRHGDVV